MLVKMLWNVGKVVTGVVWNVGKTEVAEAKAIYKKDIEPKLKEISDKAEAYAKKQEVPEQK